MLFGRGFTDTFQPTSELYLYHLWAETYSVEFLRVYVRALSGAPRYLQQKFTSRLPLVHISLSVYTFLFMEAMRWIYVGISGHSGGLPS